MLKADLHIHTKYSMDCDTPLEKIIERCLGIGINCIAIADHGTIEGALKMKELSPFTIIVAEEILTTQGEIMGMFLTENIPSGLSVEQTISEIRKQNGLVNIPHPFDSIRPTALGEKLVEEIVAQIDILEVFNSRNLLSPHSISAPDFACKHGLAQSAGSDSHTLGEIGNAYVEMPEFSGKDDFLQALAQGRIYGHRTNPLVHANNVWAKLKTRLRAAF